MNYASRVNSYAEERDSNIKYDSGLNAYLLNEGLNLETLPLEMPFMATYPFLGVRDVENNMVMTTNQCLIPVADSSGEIQTEEGEQIYDGDTVEFRYISPDAPEPHEADASIVIDEDAMRWRALRVRRGKQPNALRVCLDIWALMHSPVTSKHVAAGLTSVDLESGDLNYYLGTANKAFITEPVNKLNNFVKGYVLEKYLKTQTNSKLLDLGCGKVGDFFKYTRNGVHTFVGMDLSHDNLNNKVDGAATRILQNMNKSPRIKALADRTLLINGSFTELLSTGDAGMDALAKYYLDILYGRFKPAANPRLMRFYNLGVDGFNCVTSMYVIHYAFNNEAELDRYLENVSSSLKDQGYFIGTCLDGNSILDSLNGSSTRGMVEGLVDGTTIWRIDRKSMGAGEVYDSNMALQVKSGLPDMYTTESPFVLGTGNKINVYYETINTVSQENLVDIKYLEYKAEQHGLKLLESRCFTEEPGSMLTEYATLGADSQVQEYIEKIKKEKALMQWADWQRYFVFQKSRNA
jgi:SAM-dependent methyltransferase